MSHFNHSVKSTYKLCEKQAALHHDQLALVQEVVTSWNSSFSMVQRVLKQQQPLCACLLDLRRGDLMPSDSEFGVMESYCKVMKPLVETTEAIGAEKWVTISYIRPLLHKLLMVYLMPEESDSCTEKELKGVMLSNLTDRYAGKTLELLSKASFLDPRFKSLGFLGEEERKATHSAIMEEAAVVNITESQSDEPQPKRSRGETQLMKLLGDVVDCQQEVDAGSQHQQADREIQKYISEDPVSESPLIWWQNKRSKYPILSSLAQKYLSVLATSVPSEHAFSIAGHVVNRKRACLNPDSVNMLVFLADNLPERC